MSSTAARRQYATDGTGVVSNERMLIMLFDRLDRDLAHAAQLCALDDRTGAHDTLTHAQDILYELIGALDTDAWEGAAALQEVYVFCVNEIIEANLHQDPIRINKCRELLQPIAEAWREAVNDQMASNREAQAG